MTILLYIALAYLLITGGILYLNKQDFTALPPTPRNYFDEQAPLVTICIPARNEANSIERCVRSAIDQQYPNHHVLVLDDGSTDGTSAILESLAEQFPENLSVISGEPKPEDWLGKSWACHQLSEQALGEILIFTDADTWMEPETVSKVVRAMGSDIVDLISLWPQQKFGSFWERTVIPLVYFALLTLLPTRYVYHPPKWIPGFLRQQINPLFAAANGQFMAFKKKSYRAIGGHQSVKNDVVEDVELAKNIKRNGYRMKMYHGRNAVSCRMYESKAELWEGFRKNFFAGFNHNPVLFAGMGLLHLITFLIPILSLPFLLLWGSSQLIVLALIAILLMYIQRFIVDRWFNWRFRYGLLHPLGVSWFQVLGIQVLSDYFYGNNAQWKDRDI